MLRVTHVEQGEVCGDGEAKGERVVWVKIQMSKYTPTETRTLCSTPYGGVRGSRRVACRLTPFVCLDRSVDPRV